MQWHGEKMNSNELFIELEQIRAAITKKAATEEITDKLTALNTKLTNAGIDPELVDAQLKAFSSTFVDKKSVDANMLKADLKLAFPTANLDQSNLKVYQAILPYAQLMSEFEKKGTSIEHAYKLSLLFDDENKALQYLSNYKKNNPKTQSMMSETCKFDQEKINLDVWKKLCVKQIKDEDFCGKILPNADTLEAYINSNEKKTKNNKERLDKIKKISEITTEIKTANAEFKKLNATRGVAAKTSGDAKRELAEKCQEAEDKVDAKSAELVELGVSLNPDLSVGTLVALKTVSDLENSPILRYFRSNGLTKKDFRKFEKLNLQDDPIQIPNIKIDGKELGHPGYYLMKLDIMQEDKMQAAKAVCLGKLTDCCQTFSDKGEPCVVHGLTSPNGGFYVACKGDIENPKIEDHLLGQSWTWRSKNDAIVFDSIEPGKDATREEKKVVMNLFENLAKKLVEDKHTDKVACGITQGLSIGVNSIFDEENFKDYNGHNDSQRHPDGARYVQRVLQDKNNPFYLFGKDQDSTAKTEQSLGEAMRVEGSLLSSPFLGKLLNWALIEKNNDLLDKAKELAKENNRGDEFKQTVKSIKAFIKDDLDVSELVEKIEDKTLLSSIINKDGDTPLMSALQSDDDEEEYKEEIEKLIALAPNINNKNNVGNTPLMLAAESGLKNNMITLIEKGAEINAKNNFDKTPLMFASEEGQKKCAELLIKNNADVNAQDIEGKTALLYAVESDKMKVVDMLVENGADINLAMKYISKQDNLEDYLELASKVINLDQNLNALKKENCLPVLMGAAAVGDVGLVIKLIDKFNDVNASNAALETPILYAACANNVEIVAELVDRGADLNIKSKSGITALTGAIENGHAELALYLAKKGASLKDLPNGQKIELMYVALQSKEFAIALDVAKQDLKLSDLDDNELKNLLEYAEKNQQIEFASILIKDARAEKLNPDLFEKLNENKKPDIADSVLEARKSNVVPVTFSYVSNAKKDQNISINAENDVTRSNTVSPRK